MKLRKILFFGLLAAFFTVTLPAYAQGNGLNGDIILGGGIHPEYEGSRDYEFMPLVVGKAGYGKYYLEFKGLKLKANISPYTGLEFGPEISQRSGRDDKVDNKYVSKMRKIDDATEAGFFLKVVAKDVFMRKDALALQTEFQADTGDVNNGCTVKFDASYKFYISERQRLGFSLFTTYADSNYNQTYFGVDGDNSARSGLEQYDAKGGIKDAGVSVESLYLLNSYMGILTTAQYKQLLGDAADSPIIDHDGSAAQFVLGAGLMFRF